MSRNLYGGDYKITNANLLLEANYKYEKGNVQEALSLYKQLFERYQMKYFNPDDFPLSLNRKLWDNVVNNLNGGKGPTGWNRFVKTNYAAEKAKLGKDAEFRDVMKVLSRLYRNTHTIKVKPHGLCYKLPESDCDNKPLCKYVKPTKPPKNSKTNKPRA